MTLGCGLKFSHSFIYALIQSVTHSFLKFCVLSYSIVHIIIPIVLTALADGALNPVLALCAMKEAIALLALMTLSHIVEHQGNLAPLIEVGSKGVK